VAWLEELVQARNEAVIVVRGLRFQIDQQRVTTPRRLVEYDICDPEIRCFADRASASVFEVNRGRRVVRVLTFDLERAREIARDPFNDSSPPDDGTLPLF
jgi:hypothetical protein